MSQHHRPGAHELGQNFLRDHRIIQTIVRLAADGDGRLVEWAAGGGALTLPLAQLHRPLEAVEIDPKHLQRLRRTIPPHVCITEGDILRHAPPAEAWTLVSNVPFHITTPVLRRLLSLGRWDRAVLITQWEVARKRRRGRHYAAHCPVVAVVHLHPRTAHPRIRLLAPPLGRCGLAPHQPTDRTTPRGPGGLPAVGRRDLQWPRARHP